MTKTEEKVQKAIQQLLKMFETEELPKAVALTTINTIAGSEIPCHKWSLGNQVLTLISGTTDARGFKQWEQVGRKVKKGAKAFYILGPRTRKVKIENTGTGEEKEVIMVNGFNSLPVFRYEDTEGKELDRPDYSPPELPPLVDVAKTYGVNVQYGPFTERFYGYFSSGEKRIMLCSHDVAVFFHELAHAIHNTFKPLKGGQDKGQEIVAETVAAVLCQIYGYDGYIYQGYKYIQEYAKAENGSGVVKEIMKVLGDIQKVLEVILNTGISSQKTA